MPTTANVKRAMQDFKKYIKKKKNLRKHDTTKGSNNVPVTYPKDKEFCDFPDKEFKISVLQISMSYKKTQKDKSTKAGKQYTNKMKSLTKN